MLKIIKKPDVKTYNEDILAVKDHDGHRPCELVKTKDTKCPCKNFKNQNIEGECHCGRYIKVSK